MDMDESFFRGQSYESRVFIYLLGERLSVQANAATALFPFINCEV